MPAKKKAEPLPPPIVRVPPTPEELRSGFRQLLVTEIATSKKHLDKWADEFKANPKYALEWSAMVYEDVAKVDVMEQVLALLACEPSPPVTELIEMITKDALSKGRYIVRSTSTNANLLAQHISAAWADIAHQARMWLT